MKILEKIVLGFGLMVLPAFNCYDGKTDDCTHEYSLEQARIFDLMTDYNKADENCRGESGSVSIHGCKLRTKISKSLEKKGYCFGSNGYLPSGQDGWHPCDIPQHHPIINFKELDDAAAKEH